MRLNSVEKVDIFYFTSVGTASWLDDVIVNSFKGLCYTISQPEDYWIINLHWQQESSGSICYSLQLQQLIQITDYHG